MGTTKIVLVSDNHGNQECLKELKEMYADYDLFVHCGDSEMEYEQMSGYICVKGNNDFLYYKNVPDNQVLHIQGHTIYVCHGHMDFLSYFHYEPMIDRAKARGADIIFFGHVHTYLDTTQNGVRLLNPGSIRHNRDGSPPSYMLVEISEDDVVVTKKEYGKPDTPGFLDKLIKKLIEWTS